MDCSSTSPSFPSALLTTCFASCRRGYSKKSIVLKSQVMDRYGANFRSERAMAQQAIHFAQKCGVHIIAQSNKAGMDVLTNDMSGMLSMALAQQGSGTLGTLRALLGDVILEHLSVSYAIPGVNLPQAHRQHAASNPTAG